MFKTLATLALTLILAFSAFAQDTKKNALETEDARYAAELEAATKKINSYHLERLKVVQKNAVQAGDLDLALKAREEIKALEGPKEEKFSIVGKWKDGKTDYTFNQNHTVIRRGWGTPNGVWVIKDGKIMVKWDGAAHETHIITNTTANECDVLWQMEDGSNGHRTIVRGENTPEVKK